MGKDSDSLARIVRGCRSAARFLTHRYVVQLKCVACQRTDDMRLRTRAEAEDAVLRGALFTGCVCGEANSLLPTQRANDAIARMSAIQDQRRREANAAVIREAKKAEFPSTVFPARDSVRVRWTREQTDEALLVRLCLEDPDGSVRMTALSTLCQPESLAKVAIEGLDILLRLKAGERLRRLDDTICRSLKPYDALEQFARYETVQALRAAAKGLPAASDRKIEDILRRRRRGVELIAGSGGPSPTLEGFLKEVDECYRADRFEEAVACVVHARELWGDSETLWNEQGLCLTDMTRFREAFHCLDSGLALNPGCNGLWHNKGRALAASGQTTDAVLCYDKALALDPNQPLTWQLKGSCLSDLGRGDEAEACFDRARKLAPKGAAGKVP